MKKILPIIIIIVFLIPLFFAQPVYADQENRTVFLQSDQLENKFTFEQLGYSEKLLIGPFDSTSIYFSLPANVKLAPGSSISLQYALAWSGGGVADTKNGAGAGGTMLVYFNDELIDTFILSVDSELNREIYLSEDVLNNVDEDGRYSLRFFLNAEVNCEFNEVRTTIIIGKNSELNLEYEARTPLADLTKFPQPIYQPASILPNSAVVVIPDNPTPYELQGALTVMAGLGAVTEANLSVNLVENASLTPELVGSNHLIFVGLAKNFPNLQVVNFPVKISADNGVKINNTEIMDGVIEVGVSPWSPSSVVFFVGGNSDDGIIKASQAFSTGKMVAVEQPALSLISTVNPIEDINIPEIQTFKDIGYDDQTMGLYGENYFSYIFYASPEQAFSPGGYIDLEISHSELLDFNQTGITILLNDEVIGGLQLSGETPSVTTIKLVPGTLRRGVNRLEIISEIVPFFNCYSADILSTWVKIHSTSAIHMPVSGNKLNLGKNFNLNDFPYMFLDSKDLGDLAFIVPSDDPVSWRNAAQVAYYIGAKGSANLVNLRVIFADDVNEEELIKYNLLMFGRSTTLPIIAKINDLMPAPFDVGSDIAVQPSMLVNYSLLPDTSVGYVQLLPSPWNQDFAILTILGNTQDGITMAGSALIADDPASRLTGNFAVIYGDQVVSTDTRLGISKESIIAQLPVAVTVTPKMETTSFTPLGVNEEKRAQWILPVIGIVSLGLLTLLIVMLRIESDKKKMRQTENDTSVKPDSNS